MITLSEHQKTLERQVRKDLRKAGITFVVLTFLLDALIIVAVMGFLFLGWDWPVLLVTLLLFPSHWFLTTGQDLLIRTKKDPL